MIIPTILLAVAAGTAAFEFAALDVAQKAITGDAFIAFFMPGHVASEQLLNEWSFVESHLPAAIDKDFLVAINCASHRPLCDEQDVASYPALRYYSPDGMERYRGPRTAKDIALYLESIQRPLITNLETPDLDKFIARDVTTLIVHSPAIVDESASLLLDRLSTIASRHGREIAFGMHKTPRAQVSWAECINSETGERFEAASLDAVDALDVLVRKCNQPLIHRFSRRNELELMNMQASLVLFHSPSSDTRAAFTESFRALALRYRTYLVFVAVDSTTYPELLPAGSSVDDESPVLSVLNPHAWATFVMPAEEQVTPESVEGFIGRISRGEVAAVGGAEGQDGGGQIEESQRGRKDEL